jgi:hypothetical protein
MKTIEAEMERIYDEQGVAGQTITSYHNHIKQRE